MYYYNIALKGPFIIYHFTQLIDLLTLLYIQYIESSLRRSIYNEYTTDRVKRAGAVTTGDKGRSKHLSVTRRDRRANTLDANLGVSA